jgi:SRSO17 transposase
MTQRIGRALPPPSGRAPMMNISSRDVDGLGRELDQYHDGFAGCFVRCEQRYWALKYSQGQMLNLERKSIEPMAVAVAGGNIQAMQQFISQGAWSDDEVLTVHRRAVVETLGRPDGILILDGCDFPKQGEDSVGVGWQYCGPLGKLANCQASVVLAYATEAGATLLDRRLFLPQAWFAQDHQERWKKCGIPNEVTFQTKPALGAALIQAVAAEGVVPFRWVTMDEGYGAAGYLLDMIDRENKLFFAEIPRNKQAWPRRPKVVPPGAPGPNGRPPTRTHLAADAPPAQRVDELALSLRSSDWQRFIIHEGSKGPIEVEIAMRRIVMADEELPGRDEWLVLRRSIGAPLSEWKFYRSNAPADIAPKTLAGMTAWRWPVETVIEESKGELGLDHYEVRGWVGWHHHTTMTLLAHHFLVRLRVNRGIVAPALTVSQVRKLLQVVLPKREFNAEEAIAELARIQRQNYGAYRSHKKRRRRMAKSSPPN